MCTVANGRVAKCAFDKSICRENIHESITTTAPLEISPMSNDEGGKLLGGDQSCATPSAPHRRAYISHRGGPTVMNHASKYTVFE